MVGLHSLSSLLLIDALDSEQMLDQAKQAYEGLRTSDTKQSRDKILQQVASTAVLAAAHGVHSAVQLSKVSHLLQNSGLANIWPLGQSACLYINQLAVYQTVWKSAT